MTETFSQGRLFPKEAAEEISIAPATLRKYSQIIEEVTKQSDYFQRNEQGTRTYSKQDIQMLKKMSELSAETKKPVRTIAEDLFTEENLKNIQSENNQGKTITELATQQNNEHQSTNELLSIIEQQNKQIEQQNQKIDQLVHLMNAFTNEIKQSFNEVRPMIEKSQHLIETHEEQNEQIKENLEKIHQDTAELKEKQEEQAKENQLLENSTPNISEAAQEEKVGFFQRLFGKK